MQIFRTHVSFCSTMHFISIWDLCLKLLHISDVVQLSHKLDIFSCYVQVLGTSWSNLPLCHIAVHCHHLRCLQLHMYSISWLHIHDNRYVDISIGTIGILIAAWQILVIHCSAVTRTQLFNSEFNFTQGGDYFLLPWVGTISDPHWVGTISNPHWVGTISYPHWVGAISYPHWVGTISYPHWVGTISYPHWQTRKMCFSIWKVVHDIETVEHDLFTCFRVQQLNVFFQNLSNPSTPPLISQMVCH